jgi:hypothetical protein
LEDFIIGDYSKNEEIELVVGSIIILYESLSAAALYELFSSIDMIPVESINEILGLLYSVLDVPEDPNSSI